MSTFFRASLIGLLGAVTACGSGGDPSSGVDLIGAVSKDRIIGGAAYTGAPATGSIRYQGQNFCTGTVIAPRRVVTAAHCLDEDIPATSFTFALGPDASNPTEVINIVSGTQHPDWDSTNILNDIAYVTLAWDAPVTPSLVLDTLDTSWINVNLLFVGYGVDDGNRQSGNGIKRAVTIPISEVGTSQFAYETAGLNTCTGDSGGPAFFVDPAGNFLLAGTTSYGDTYCTDYGVDTSVPSFKSFLGVTGTAPQAASSGGGTGTGGGTGGGTGTGGGGENGGGTGGGCGTETFVGRCDGNVVTWCESSTVYQVNCASRNKVCGYSDVDGYNGCMTTAATTDPCNGETYYGRCNSAGTSVIWCENNAVQTLSCVGTGVNAQGQNFDYNGTCGLDTTRNVLNCLY
ncbi:MAG: trypsin-like serine protease [Clostridia bacterium]|nr:trypsin-like serine protease [Deltaproteobacteria bacterium]